jgi:hypothetical protein
VKILRIKQALVDLHTEQVVVKGKRCKAHVREGCYHDFVVDIAHGVAEAVRCRSTRKKPARMSSNKGDQLHRDDPENLPISRCRISSNGISKTCSSRLVCTQLLNGKHKERRIKMHDLGC